MYNILKRNGNTVTVQFQNYVYPDVCVGTNEDRCIKLFLRKKLFGRLDLQLNTIDELSYLIKETNNTEYCFLDLRNIFTLQLQLKTAGFPYVETCLPMSKQDVVNFVKAGTYVIRPCVGNSCYRPYFNKLYTTSEEILKDLAQQHRWEDIQQSISFRKRKTVDSFSKFVIQEYAPHTEIETVIVNDLSDIQSDLIKSFVTKFNIKDCSILINLNKNHIDQIEIFNVHNCVFDYYKHVNKIQF